MKTTAIPLLALALVCGPRAHAASFLEKLGLGKPSNNTTPALASGLLQGVGNLLTGQKSVDTNQPPTNAAPKLNPLDLLKKKK